MTDTLATHANLPKPSWLLQQVYTKNLHFSCAPLQASNSIPPIWPPKVSVKANPRYIAIEPEKYELTLTVLIELHQDKGLIGNFLLELVGIVFLPKVFFQQRDKILYGFASNMLFGYVNVHLNYRLRQARLPQIHLAPLDFVQLYQQQTASTDG